ncbi:MAG TPA: DUF6356 family protein [Woeseiaceae bacterium]|nr:DUF6356 family protein [Woeseiaceae bacterium]
MSLGQKFTEHPATVGETYGEHFFAAMGFSLSLLRAAFCCGLHAVFPFLCEKTGSQCIEGLYERMVKNRSRLAEERKGKTVEA